MLFSKPTLIGHRGLCAFAPENTMESFEKALEAGLTWVEFDIRMAASGELVVIHDETVQRTTNGVGFVHAHTLHEIKKLKPSVPTFLELLNWSQQTGCHLNIEIKSMPHQTIPTTQRLLHELQAFSATLPAFIVSSFEHECLVYYEQHRKVDEKIGYLMEIVNWEVVEGLLPEKHLIHCGLNQVEGTFEQLAALGFEVLVYTVNDLGVAQKLIHQGVKGLFTDCLREGSLV